MTKELKLVVGFSAGLASGKSSVTSCLSSQGYEVVNTGEILEEIIKERGCVDYQREDLRKLFEQIQEPYNTQSDLLLKTIVQSIQKPGVYVIDSVRHYYQDEFLRSIFPNYCLVFLETPLEKRYQLNSQRARFFGDDKMSLDDFIKFIRKDGEKEVFKLRERAHYCLGFFPDLTQRMESLEVYLNNWINQFK